MVGHFEYKNLCCKSPKPPVLNQSTQDAYDATLTPVVLALPDVAVVKDQRHQPDLAGFRSRWPILGRLEEPFGDVGQVLLVVDSQDQVVAEDDLPHRRKHHEAVVGFDSTKSL